MKEREREGEKRKNGERERDIVFYACWWDNNDADLYKKKLNVKREKTQRPSTLIPDGAGLELTRCLYRS